MGSVHSLRFGRRFRVSGAFGSGLFGRCIPAVSAAEEAFFPKQEERRGGSAEQQNEHERDDPGGRVGGLFDREDVGHLVEAVGVFEADRDSVGAGVFGGAVELEVVGVEAEAGGKFVCERGRDGFVAGDFDNGAVGLAGRGGGKRFRREAGVGAVGVRVTGIFAGGCGSGLFAAAGVRGGLAGSFRLAAGWRLGGGFGGLSDRYRNLLGKRDFSLRIGNFNERVIRFEGGAAGDSDLAGDVRFRAVGVDQVDLEAGLVEVFALGV